jgi:hypothetical protein
MNDMTLLYNMTNHAYREISRSYFAAEKPITALKNLIYDRVVKKYIVIVLEVKQQIVRFIYCYSSYEKVDATDEDNAATLGCDRITSVLCGNEDGALYTLMSGHDGDVRSALGAKFTILPSNRYRESQYDRDYVFSDRVEREISEVIQKHISYYVRHVRM